MNKIFTFERHKFVSGLNQNDNIIPSGEPLAREYETLSREELKKRLQNFIQDMLDSNFEKLTNLMYRHDVTEDKFHEALERGPIEEQAGRLADLVIERELEKVATRKAYRKYKNDQIRDELE